MLGLLFFALSLSAGYTILSWCVPFFSVWLRWVAGGVVGIVLAAWSSFLFALPTNIGIGIALSYILLLVISVLGWRKYHEPRVKAKYSWWIFGITFVILAGYLYSLHALRIGDAGAWYVPGYSWGDTPLHMTLMSSVAYQDHVPLYFPIFYQSSLSYPFLVDFYSGVLLRLGVSWQLSLFLPNILLFLSGCYLSVQVVYAVTKRVKVAVLQLLLFLFAGSSWGLVEMFQQYGIQGTKAVLLNDYTNMGDKFLNFANPVTSHFLPQRSFEIGFAVAMLIILLLIKTIQESHKSGYSLWVAAVLTGLLPLLHVHSFFVVLLIWGLLSVALLLRRDGTPRHWYVAILVLVVIALPQLWWQFISTYHDGFGRWYTGWMRPASQTVLEFWWRNIGLELPLLIAVPWVLWRIKNRYLTVLVSASVIIAIAANLRIFQPNDFDNMKILLYAYWGLMIPTAWILVKIWDRKLAPIAFLVFILLTGSGILAVVRETRPEQSYALFTKSDIQTAADLRSVLPINARVLTMSEHNNIVPTLTGRAILVGYDGWLWSYGIQYTPEMNARADILTGAIDSEQLIKQYGLTHLVLSDVELAQYGIDLSVLTEKYQVIYAQNGWYVFKLTQ